MAQVITEDDIASGELKGSTRYWTYCGLDGIVTNVVRNVIEPRVQADKAIRRTALFEMACQKAALTMMLRGAAFDEHACGKAIREWETEEKRLTEIAREIIGPLWDKTERRKGKCEDGKPHRWNNASNYKARVDCLDSVATCVKCGCSRLVACGFNPLSSPQVIHLLYDILKLPVQHSRKGKRRITADDEALERLINMPKTSEEHVTVLQSITDVRGAHKQIGFLKSTRSSDGRLRQSVNVGAAETGRWSASKDPFRQGTNFQNIADRSRNVIIADPGLWFFYADLEQAESRIVAHDAECEQDIQDHNEGDTHTNLCQTLFPELSWGSAPDKKVAQTPLPWDAEHDYRHVAKIVRHGTNIAMSGQSIAREIRQPKIRGDELRRGYFDRYPENLRRQKEIMAIVREKGILVTPLGRKRQFFGRLWEASTQREGLAQTQQSTIADLLNLALVRIWEELDLGVNMLNAPRPSDPNKVWLIAQVHDAILGLIRPHDITTLRRVIELMTIPLDIHGRRCVVPVEVQLGQNFRHFNPKKPETVGGLSRWLFDKRTGKICIFNRKEDLS